MIFSSLVFLCIFLPVTYIVYTLIPSIKIKNAVLIIASFLFYSYGEPVYVILMFVSALLNFGFALLIRRYYNIKKQILTLSVIVNLGILGVFKYVPFFVESCNAVFHMHVKVPEIALPIGISFFTFQALSYVIDVYRGKVEAEKNFLHILLYIAFFPQLIAGPIVKYRDISREIHERKQTLTETAEGMRRFICGLSKKVLIANTMGMVADNIFGAESSEINIVAAWLGAVTYMLQIYYDFSGYSDMAIGMGKMFGFHFKENFQYPYGATGIQDFWKKWHISLTTWFREYLYIPLGGNRRGNVWTYCNRMIVFFLTGLWHGASWTFVLWGLYHGILMFIERLLPAVRRLPKAVSCVYTLVLVCIGFVIFRADNVSQAFYIIKQMFTGFDFGALSQSLVLTQLTPFFIFFLLIAVFGAAPVKGIADRVRNHISSGQESVSGTWCRADRILYVASILLLVWCIIRLSSDTYNPFIYFRF